MSGRQRWDVVLYFPDGPMSLKGDLVCRGPVVRLGANPGPGGLKIDGCRGLDDRQAVISAYDGATVSIAPVGSNQVRISPHPHVDWSAIQPIRGPQYLSPESAFHLGPPGRGCTVIFLDARKLGQWEQQRVLSDAADVNPEVEPSEVRELRSSKWPLWFVPSLVMLAMLISVALVAPWIGEKMSPPTLLGPVDAGLEFYEEPPPIASLGTQVNVALYDGLEQAWMEFVVIPNSEVADDVSLQDKENWDTRLLQATTLEIERYGSAQKVWERLEDSREDYAAVVRMLREKKMPEGMAGIPYVESRYRATAVSPVCAGGWWQFMPEVANRMDLRMVSCTLRGSAQPWAPVAVVPPKGILRSARYIDRDDPNCGIGGEGKPDRNCCLITSCQVDEREDLAKSTRGAIELLSEAWGPQWPGRAAPPFRLPSPPTTPAGTMRRSTATASLETYGPPTNAGWPRPARTATRPLSGSRSSATTRTFGIPTAAALCCTATPSITPIGYWQSTFWRCATIRRTTRKILSFRIGGSSHPKTATAGNSMCPPEKKY